MRGKLELRFPEKRLSPPTPEQRERVFRGYEDDLLISSKDYKEKILVVGCGDASFAYEAERRGLVGPGMVDNIDIAAPEYHPAGSHAEDLSEREQISHNIVLSITQADSRDLSMIPDGSYKLVVARNSVPSCFIAWLASEEEKREMSQEDFSQFSSAFLNHGDAKDVPAAIYRSLREMLRVASPDGEVRLIPIVVNSLSSAGQRFAQCYQDALARLHGEFNFTEHRFKESISSFAGAPVGTFGVAFKKNISGEGKI